MEIKKIKSEDREKALDLVWTTFLQYEAPDYSKEGIETFQNAVIKNEDYLKQIVLYGAYEGNDILGVIATKNEGRHITLFFVEGSHQRQGIGRMLFDIVLENCPADIITVNSSPFAVEVYHHLGFMDTDLEQTTEGIRYTPMTYIK